MPDLSILKSACATVVETARAGQTVIVTSTTYVGCTTELVVRPLAERGLIAGVDVSVAFSPERIDPGNDRHAHEDVPRVVGGVTAQCAERSSAVLAGYAKNVHAVVSPEAAEMVKLMENTFRAVNIALANEFAEVCSALRLRGARRDRCRRDQAVWLHAVLPGPRGGRALHPLRSALPVVAVAEQRVQTPVIEQAMVGIATRPRRIVQRVREVLSDNGRGLGGSRVLVARGRLQA